MKRRVVITTGLNSPQNYGNHLNISVSHKLSFNQFRVKELFRNLDREFIVVNGSLY